MQNTNHKITKGGNIQNEWKQIQRISLIIALLLAVFIRVIPTYAEEEIISSEIETISSDSEGLSDSLDVVEEVFSKASSYDISSQFVAQVHEYNRKLVEGSLDTDQAGYCVSNGIYNADII